MKVRNSEPRTKLNKSCDSSILAEGYNKFWCIFFSQLIQNSAFLAQWQPKRQRQPTLFVAFLSSALKSSILLIGRTVWLSKKFFLRWIWKKVEVSEVWWKNKNQLTKIDFSILNSVNIGLSCSRYKQTIALRFKLYCFYILVIFYVFSYLNSKYQVLFCL